MSKTLKFGIFILIILCLFLLAMTIMDFPSDEKDPEISLQSERTPDTDTPDDLITAVTAELETGFEQFADESHIIDHILIQDDGQLAAVWMAAVDEETGDIIAREPELILAERDPDGVWQLLAQGDEKFAEVFQSFQYAEKSVHGDLDADPAPMSKAGTVFGGYYLPWAENLTKRLTWSVGHTSCTPTYYCTHAFDFADGTMFPLVAAKGGTVFHWKDTCANGDSSCTNSITLQDRSTTPWTYQIYLHIAKGSIPSNLKQVGATVRQGQFIANVDDTGYSTGHHVHFMVVTENTKYLSGSGYIWGVAEDITFRDVTINWHSGTQGGRPRLATEAATYGGVGQTYYTSGNKPAYPPTGALTAPANKTYVTGPNLTVAGSGQDDIAVVKFEILAKYGTTDWVTISEQTANPFNASVNLCNTDIPDGPFQLALRVWDYEGNPSAILSARKLIRNIECGTAGSDPQVSLTRTNGNVLLTEGGLVSASVTPGSGGSAITSVEFWFHGVNWNQGDWVKLGTDTDGSNGWQAPFTVAGLSESNQYTVMAVVTDAAGRKGVDVSFVAIVDKTGPWINVVSIPSPVMDDIVTLSWTGGDSLSGLDYYSLFVTKSDRSKETLAETLPGSTTSYEVSVSPEELMIFELVAYDLSGNQTSRKFSLYADGYEFPNSYIFPLFFDD